MKGPLPAASSSEHAELLARYRLSLERRGLLESSIVKIVQQLRALARWIEPRSILDANREDVEAFLDHRKTRDDKRIGSRTRYYWVANAHTFFGWAMTEGLTDSDPTRAIVRPRQRRVLPRPIGDEDLELAIRGAPSRCRAALMLAAFAGLRCQEIAGLERDDVLEAKGLLRIRHGKGERERIVPLRPDVLEALRCLPMPKTGRLFLRDRGGQYTPNALSHFLNRYLRECGIDATPHQLRHWFATEVYASTHDIRVTQELLGHSDPSTTAGYIAYSHVDAAAAVAALSLRAS